MQKHALNIRSMTGYGRSEIEQSGTIWVAEIRCVNNRFLDCKIKIPKGLLVLEEKIRKKLSQVFGRGRIDFLLSQVTSTNTSHNLSANVPLAQNYLAVLETLGKECGLREQPSLTLLASFPDIIVRDQQNDDIDALWPMIEQLVDSAFQNCDGMRLLEGRALADDVLSRITAFSSTIDQIELKIPLLIEQRKLLLEERLARLLDTIPIDPMRLAQEVAILADKTDVSEEIVRLRSHIKQFTQYMHSEQGVGRKLDFLVQEFLREVNTLASKITDASIAHMTVELKSELEKIREQIQNIE